MMKEKVTCHLCGLDFYPHTIIYHDDRAYCYMCDFDYLVERMAEKRVIRMPSYFVNKQHFFNFQLLFTQIYSKNGDPFDYILAAYINGIPAIFNIYPREHSVFVDIPFIWQYNWHVYHFIDKHNEFYRVSVNLDRVPPVKNVYVKRLEKDYQILLELGHFLMSRDERLRIFGFHTIEDYMKYISNELTAAGNQVLNEIFSFYCKGAR